MRTFVVGVFFFLPLVFGQRQSDMEATRNAILAECQQAANGDWDAWFSSLKPFRTDMLQAVMTAMNAPLPSFQNPANKVSLLFSTKDMANVAPANAVAPAASPGDTLAAYSAGDRGKNIAVQLTAWLKARDIDLIVVPIPTKPDIYPDHFVSNPAVVPPSLLVAPQFRHRILSYLDAGVEVLDVLPTFLKLRRTSPRSLFMAVDKHWNEHPQRVTAELISTRLSRYSWVKAAQAAPPLYDQVEGRNIEWYSYQKFLPPSARRETAMWTVVPKPGSKAPVISPDASVLITGDSFVGYGQPFEAGLVGHTARLLNMPVSYSQVSGNTVQTFQDMFRNPRILEGKRVVIWIMNYEPFVSNNIFPERFKTPAN